MKTYKIMLEVVLKDDSIESNDFIYAIIEQAIETGEHLYNYHLEDINELTK